MPEKITCKIEKNQPIAQNVYFMRLAGPTGSLQVPGQFVNICLPGFYLRRPFSVADWDAAGLNIIYKVLGSGTAQMAAYPPGMQLDVLAGLGNGFATQPALQAARAQKQVLLLGGGVGVPPLYGLAKALLAQGVTPGVLLGFRTQEDVFFAEEFRALGCPVAVALELPQAQNNRKNNEIQYKKGLITHLMEQYQDYYYFSCGPMGMLRAVHAAAHAAGAQGQLSFEERMGCGFGACMGCSCQTLLGPKRVCVDGPVFFSREVMFQ